MRNIKKIYVLAIVGIFLGASVSALMYGTQNENTFSQNKLTNSEEIVLEKPEFSQKMPTAYFTENKGQVLNEDILFYSASENMQIGFTESAVLLKLIASEYSQEVLVRMNFEEAFEVKPFGEDRLEFKSNYFLGSTSSKWCKEVLNYEKIIYSNIYNGIDLVFYITEKGLKYDFIVYPGADPSQITVNYEGIDGLEIDSAGNLLIHTALGEIRESVPYTYQGLNEQIECEFVLRDSHSYGFSCANWDPFRVLTIDPILEYSTYIGGIGVENCNSHVLAYNGDVYLVGWTSSVDFPVTPGAYQTTLNDPRSDGWFAKLKSDWSSFLFVSYFGGSTMDTIINVDLDNSGNIYLVGITSSSDFPITIDAYQSTYKGWDDCFISVFDPSGTNLIYSTYFGGSGHDQARGFTFDNNGDYYIAGMTGSPDLPVTMGAYDTTFNDGDPIPPWGATGLDAYVAKFDSVKNERVYVTYIGGTKNDFICSIEIDSEGRAVILGASFSEDYPTTPNAYDTSYNGCTFFPYGYQIYGGDIVVCLINADGSDLIYSTFLGGSQFDSGWDILLDSSGDAYFTGSTLSPDFSTTLNAYDTSYGGGSYIGDGILAKLDFDSFGSDSLKFSTYLGGSDEDTCEGIALDPRGNIYISGLTSSTDLPTTLWALYPTKKGDPGIQDAYIAKLDPTGSSLLYSTYYGGTGQDSGAHLGIDDSGFIYTGGFTSSDDFPTTPGAADTTYNGGDIWTGDGYIMKWDIPDASDMLDLLIEQVEDLVDEGKLNRGQGNSLISKLQAAKNQVDKGHNNPAINLLEAFKNEVNAMVKTNKLCNEQGQTLTEMADHILIQLN